MYNSYSVTRLAATVAAVMGAEPPRQSEPAIPVVTEICENAFGGKKADKVLIYNPDCVGQWMFQKYTEDLLPVYEAAPLAIPVLTVEPSWTPVCFGSMYTGVFPKVHGIRSYMKPVITTDSLFDSLPRSGKKVALVAVEDSSLAMIFQNRDIDYYIESYDGEAVERALSLIEEGRHDLVVIYNEEYDDMIHRTLPESPEAMAAFHRHIESFERLTKSVKKNWQEYNSMVVWASDHGNHVDKKIGRGNHGTGALRDMNIVHCYGFYPGKASI